MTAALSPDTGTRDAKDLSSFGCAPQLHRRIGSGHSVPATTVGVVA